MEKRYQVFISSTYADLEDERKKVMEAILECDCFPCGMEMFPSFDMEQFEYIKSVIHKCDYYILVISGRYGSLAVDGISYTEKEYDYAVQDGIPVLVFLKRDIESIPANKTDGNKKLKNKLLAFRKKVQNGRLVSFWDDSNELKASIISSLHRAFKEMPRIGWIRGDNVVNSDDSTKDEAHKINSHIKKHRNYMVIEVSNNGEVIYQSDRIATILSTDGNEDFAGIFNAEALQVLRAYPKLDEFVSIVYNMACDIVEISDVDKVMVGFVEYNTDTMLFDISISPDKEQKGVLKYGFIDWTEGNTIFKFGEDWMN